MKHRLALLVIILIAFILRFYQLGGVPLSPDWDEVALGYNAYSILHTGRDEYGEFLPVVLRSFNDYKPALYAYLIIPFIPFFDLSVFAVRLPSALMGVVTVLTVYVFVKELFKPNSLDNSSQFTSNINKNTSLVDETRSNKQGYIWGIPLLVAFLMAISPWHIQFSRIGFEANVGLGLNVLMALFFLKGLRRPWLLIISGVFATLSIYTYQSEKIFTPLIIMSLVILYGRELLKVKRVYIISALCVSLFLLCPMIKEVITNQESLSQARGVSIFSDTTNLLKTNTERLSYYKINNDFIGLVLNNRRVIYGKAILSNYLSHYDFVWLFIKGDFEVNRHHAPYMGLMYIVELPFLLIGVYQLAFGNYPKKTKLLLFSWILIAPLPASITNGVPHAVRTLNMIPALIIFSALGFIKIYSFFTSIKRRYIFLVGLFPFLLLNFSYYLNQYFVQQNYLYALDWQYGYENIVKYTESTKYNYKKIIVSNVGEMSQSYMFFLFYTKYDPVKYLNQGGTKSGGLETNGNKFEKYYFKKINIHKENTVSTLFVGNDADLPDEFKIIYNINYPNGDTAIKAVVR